MDWGKKYILSAGLGGFRKTIRCVNNKDIMLIKNRVLMLGRQQLLSSPEFTPDFTSVYNTGLHYPDKNAY